MQQLQAEGIVCVVIDLTEVSTSQTTPEQWYAGLIYSLVSSLNLHDTFDLMSWWSAHSSLSYVQRFSEFLEKVLLPSISQNIVIFLEEIDCTLSLKFSNEDFFAVIRDCYNKRVDNSDYRRLTFALVGVATPSDLMPDKWRNPFNIGRAIELAGFSVEEAQPLAVGFQQKASNPTAVLQAVLDWTGGQPFLTQKVCQLIVAAEEPIPTGREAEWVGNLVRSHIINNWKASDEPEHLKTISNRLLWRSPRKRHLLKLYRQICLAGEIKASDRPEQMELQLSGLVVKQQGKLRIYNRIYASVFNQSWVDEVLAEVGWQSQWRKTKILVLKSLRLLHRAFGNLSLRIDLSFVR